VPDKRYVSLHLLLLLPLLVIPFDHMNMLCCMHVLSSVMHEEKKEEMKEKENEVK
jgi:hypothetical protein